jgi:hypothetical protein
LLYAGKIRQIYKYIYRKNVKILYIWIYQQRLKKKFFFNFSETIRNNNININFKLFKQLISIHNSKYYKPLNNEQLGHYLAGLIDGKGNFDKNGNLIITYENQDIKAAYWLKSQIGYGRVLKNPNKGYKYVLSHPKGLLLVIELINNKLRTINIYNQIKNNILIKKMKNDLNLNLNQSIDFCNHWLSGFIDSIGIFTINKINKEIILKLQITQKNENILNDIKYFLCNINNKELKNSKDNNNSGCFINKQKDQNNYYLEITSLSINKNIITYLDQYPLISNKYINYLNYRKVYILIQNKQHLTINGISKIKKYIKKNQKIN